jgi:hypothetical protein
VHDDDVEGAIGQRQRVHRGDVHVDEQPRFGRHGAGALGLALVAYDQRRVATQSGLRREHRRQTRIAETDLQHAFAHAHARHGDRQRLSFDRRLAQEPAHFLLCPPERNRVVGMI